MTTITNAAIQQEIGAQPGSTSKKVIWFGRIMSAVPALLLLLSVDSECADRETA
jgi:hypothetical protein